MKVSEAIERLKECDPDAELCVLHLGESQEETYFLKVEELQESYLHELYLDTQRGAMEKGTIVEASPSKTTQGMRS